MPKDCIAVGREIFSLVTACRRARARIVCLIFTFVLTSIYRSSTRVLNLELLEYSCMRMTAAPDTFTKNYGRTKQVSGYLQVLVQVSTKFSTKFKY
jgi:hypothetical protein